MSFLENVETWKIMASHAVAFYGTTRYKTKVTLTYKQRYLKKRKDNIKQRYWKKVTVTKTKYVKGGQRLTVYGSPQEITEVKKKMTLEHWIPKKKYVDKVSAELFLRHPTKYARHGKWTKFEEQET